MPLNRREFMSLLALAGAGAACSRGGNGGPQSFPRTGTIDEIMGGRDQELQVIVPPYEILTGREEYVSVVLLDNPAGTPVANTDAAVWFAKQRTDETIGPFPMRALGEGFGERGIYAARPSFPDDGIWIALAEATADDGTSTVGLSQVQVGQVPGKDMPRPGEQAVDVHSPTVRAPRGVDPICTRPERCAMHRVSLRDSLRSDRPTVLLIGTWAFCQSRFCGPEVDALENVSLDVEGADFIHVEVLVDDEADTVAAYQGRQPEGYRGTPLAPVPIAYNLAEEPAIYFIEPDGTIQQRLLGAIDETAMREAASELLG